jgi:protein transport protein SEC31
MKLKDVARTATFAWDQSSSASPLLATGAAAGALDESFSNESQLEIWSPDFGESQGMYLGTPESGPRGSITVNSRQVRACGLYRGDADVQIQPTGMVYSYV